MTKHPPEIGLTRASWKVAPELGDDDDDENDDDDDDDNNDDEARRSAARAVQTPRCLQQVRPRRWGPSGPYFVALLSHSWDPF